MSARERIETALLASVFALTAVFPAGLILATVAAVLFPGETGYDLRLASVPRGLVRDAEGLGIAAALPVFVLLIGVGFAVREAIRGRTGRPARLVGGGTALALLAVLVVAPDPRDLRAARLAFALAATGLTIAFLGAGWDAWRAARGAAS